MRIAAAGRGRPTTIGALALLAALAAEDARRGFDLLNPGTLLLLLLGSAVLAGRFLLLHRRQAPRSRGPALLAGSLGALVIALAVNGLLVHGGIAALEGSWPASEERRLEERSERLRRAFDAVLDASERPLQEARDLAARNPISGEPRSERAAFALLERLAPRNRSGRDPSALAIHGAGGRHLAWWGEAGDLPAELLALSIPRETTKWLLVAEGGVTRLVAMARPWTDPSLLLTAETPLASIYDQRVLAAAFPGDLLRTREDRVNFADYRASLAEMADLFAQEGDRLPGTSAARPSLRVALRSKDRTFLGFAALAGRPLAEAREALVRRRLVSAHLLVAGAAVLFLGWILLPRPAPPPSGPSREIALQAVRIASTWAVRHVLLLFPVPVRLWGQDLDDPALFASRAFWGLFGSPQDCLLTSLAVLATGVLVSLTTTRLLLTSTMSRRRAAEICLAALVLAAFLLGVTVPAQARRLVGDSRVDLLTVRPFDPSPARVAMQLGAAFCLLGLILPIAAFAWGAVWAAPPRRARGASLPPLPTDETVRWIMLVLLPCVAATSVILELSLQPAATAVLTGFLEDDLARVVRMAPTSRRLSLHDSIEAVKAYPALAERIAATDPNGDPTLAHDLWESTPLAAQGYGASLMVGDEEGRLISRFSRNFPPMLDERGLERPDLAEERIEEFTTGHLLRPLRALHAHVVVRRGEETVGSVAIHLRNDFGDVPPLTPPSPYQEALGETRPAISYLPRWARSISMTVYDAKGVPVLASPSEPPPPPEALLRALPQLFEGRWQVRAREGGGRDHDLFFGSAGHLVALGFTEPGWVARGARAINLAVQTSAWLLALVAPWGLASSLRLGWRLRPSRILGALTRTHYRRLVTTFLVASLAPLAILAVALGEYIGREIEQDLNDRAWTLFLAARNQVEDVALGPEGPPGDAELFNLCENVGEDLNLFVDGSLRATSNLEPYLLGALPPRLDSDVYQLIELEGRRVVLGRTGMGGRSYRTISGVVSLGIAGEGILSILLTGQRAEVERRAQEVYDAMLLISASVVVLMSGLAWVLARRIAAPIRRLSAAAARIADGDLDAEVHATAPDETGDLIASFNAMARAIKRQRDDLEQRADYIDKILLNATTGVLTLDFRGRIVTLNPAAVAILGVPSLGRGQDLAARLSESPDYEPLVGALRACLKSPAMPREVEAEIGPAGEARHARARIVPFMEGAGLLVFLDDVTETIRSNRLAAWAEMARRIGHEVKNPLTPIQLSVDHIRRVFADDSPRFAEVLEECLRTITEQVEDLRGIAAQFAAYARPPEIRREPTRVREFLEDVVRPYRTAPPPGVTIECDFDGDLATLDLDRSLMSQALVNLIENALQAMPEGGRLLMQAAVAGEDGERSLHVTVSDTGVGMDREALAKVFEPYFSTKVAGTGLGMAVARRAIEVHSGRIELTSAPRQGTTARIVLPIP